MFLGLNVGEAQEPELLAPDEEYEFQVTSAEVRQSEKTGGKFLMLRAEPVEFPKAKEVTKVFMFPTDQDSERSRNNRLFSIRQFVEACGLDPDSGVEDPEDLKGQRFYAIVGEEESKEYGKQNFLKKFVVSN